MSDSSKMKRDKARAFNKLISRNVYVYMARRRTEGPGKYSLMKRPYIRQQKTINSPPVNRVDTILICRVRATETEVKWWKFESSDARGLRG